MGRQVFLLFCFCFLALSRSYAAISPEDYWKSKLPTTPMPQPIKDALVQIGGGINRPQATSLASTTGYDGLLSYNSKAPVKNSLASTNGYDGLLSYNSEDSTKESLASTNSYDGLLSYEKNKVSTKESLASTSGYDGLLSYEKNKVSTKESLASTSGYDGLLSYEKNKVSTKESLASTSGYDGLLSYEKSKASTKESLASTSGYDGLLSYEKNKASTKESLASTSGYDGLLSYSKSSAKNSLASTNGYDGLLSYAKASSKDSLASTKGYDGLLSYNKASENQVQSEKNDDEDSNLDSNVPTSLKDHVFFVEEDLQVGKTKELVFKKGDKKSRFLPREVSNKIPFSSDRLQEILKTFSLEAESPEAKVVSRWVNLCEEPKVEGVEKQCVTSLESMVDFVVSNMGKNVKALSTEVDKDHLKMEYTIHGVKKIAKNDHESVVCHKMAYPYALFFCHRTATIRSYMVTLVGSDGTKIKAVAACHKETNEFLTNYMINVLKVTPGSTRVCHFPGAEDNIIWVVA